MSRIDDDLDVGCGGGLDVELGDELDVEVDIEVGV